MEAKQCLFMPTGIDDAWYSGFLVNNSVVCACCGQIYDLNTIKHLYVYKDWLNLVDVVMDSNVLPRGLIWGEDGYIEIADKSLDKKEWC